VSHRSVIDTADGRIPIASFHYTFKKSDREEELSSTTASCMTLLHISEPPSLSALPE
jgi:hypothetical protein